MMFLVVDGGPLGWVDMSVYLIMTSRLKKLTGLWKKIWNCYCKGLPLRGWEAQSCAGLGVHTGGDIPEMNEKKKRNGGKCVGNIVCSITLLQLLLLLITLRWLLNFVGQVLTGCPLASLNSI